MGLHCLQIKCYYTFQKCTHTIHSFCNAFILQIPNESEKHIGLQLFLKVFFVNVIVHVFSTDVLDFCPFLGKNGPPIARDS